MRYAFLLLFFSVSTALAYSDMDLDGVDDSVDRCPHTPITDIVDENGCSIETVLSQEYFEAALTLSYSDMNYRLNERSDTITTSLQLGYGTAELSIDLYLSYYTLLDPSKEDKSGMNDTLLTTTYSWSLSDSLSIDAGAGVWLPTYGSEFGNNETDYTFFGKVTQNIKRWSLFFRYGYTLVMDNDIKKEDFALSYQNSSSLGLGAGYTLFDNLFFQTAYYRSDSIYKGVEAIETISFGLFFPKEGGSYFRVGYDRGLSDSASDNCLSFGIGTLF